MISGQVFTILSIVVAAAEVTIGLAIVIAIFRNFKEIDTDNINLLKW
jgi:NADH-quinone oxidoreductase subunit K